MFVCLVNIFTKIIGIANTKSLSRLHTEAHYIALPHVGSGAHRCAIYIYIHIYIVEQGASCDTC